MARSRMAANAIAVRSRSRAVRWRPPWGNAAIRLIEAIRNSAWSSCGARRRAWLRSASQSDAVPRPFGCSRPDVQGDLVTDAGRRSERPSATSIAGNRKP